jgi:hypothetical protein
MPPKRHDLPTVLAIAIIASAFATLLHEGLGHGGMALLHHAQPTELTSNHLSAVREDKWIDAAGTVVNVVFGFLALALTRTVQRPNTKYFLYLFAALNLLPGAGYFLFSGIGGIGDWAAVIAGLPHQAALRTGMALFGASSYLLCVRLLGQAIKPFVTSKADYARASIYPWLAACIFSCIAGAFDPLGLKLLFLSTIPAAFGGSSGMAWGFHLIPHPAQTATPIEVARSTAWMAAAAILGIAYIAILGPGLHFKQ